MICFTFTLHNFNFVFQLDTEPDDPIKFLKSVEEEKKKEKERIARNVSWFKMLTEYFLDLKWCKNRLISSMDNLSLDQIPAPLWPRRDDGLHRGKY